MVEHSWTYLPDLSETIAHLAALEATVSAYEVFHFADHWLEHARKSPKPCDGCPASRICQSGASLGAVLWARHS